MKDDKIILRIREARHRISAKFGHDIEKMVKYYVRKQGKHKSCALAVTHH